MMSSHCTRTRSLTANSDAIFSLQNPLSSGDTSYDLYNDSSVEHLTRILRTTQPRVQAQGETRSHRHATTFDTLPGDVLLDIFYSYQTDDDSLIPPSCRWLTLVHVCRRWRQIVFGSPRRLDLQLLCTHRTPVRKNLGFWPPLPMFIKYGPAQSLTTDDEGNLFAALEHLDRIGHVDLRLPSPQLRKLAAEMQESLPALKQLTLLSADRNAPVLPGGFLGRDASCLQRITLGGNIFPELPPLLLSSRDLVSLDLYNIPRNGYISPNAMVACLAGFPRLERFLIGFHLATPRHYRVRLPLAIRTVLPSLTYIELRGANEYLEELLSQINSPRLNQIDITYFNQLVDLQAAQLFKLIDLSEDPELTLLTHAVVTFTNRLVSLEIYQYPPRHPNQVPVRTSVVCQGIDWQVSHIAQVLNHASTILSRVVHLDLEESGADEDRQLESMDKGEWLHLLRPFSAVETLHVAWKLARHVALALEDVTEEMVLEVLPALSSIRLVGLLASSVDKFLAVRRLSGRPVTVQNTHITRSSGRAEQADLVLERAMKLLEQHWDAVGSDNCSMAMGWLTRARDYQSGLEDKGVIGHYQQSHTYLEQAQKTLRNIELLTLDLYSFNQTT